MVAVTDPAAAGQPLPAGTFYDTRRGAYYTKPLLRGWLHLLWFEVSLIFGTLLLARAHGAERITAVAIYAASVSGMFGISALYHRGNWNDAWRRRLQRLDHVMIFFLIAGTATPIFLLTDHGTFRVACLVAMWALTLTAVTIRMVRMNAPELVAGAIFVGLGWLAILALPGVWAHKGVAPALLMLTGGLLYTAGALSYHRRWPDPVPSVFGYHEVFHAYVCAGATCQFVAIALFIS
jgi:hemolysin III